MGIEKSARCRKCKSKRCEVELAEDRYYVECTECKCNWRRRYKKKYPEEVGVRFLGDGISSDDSDSEPEAVEDD
jgi:hypothetical protein